MITEAKNKKGNSDNSCRENASRKNSKENFPDGENRKGFSYSALIGQNFSKSLDDLNRQVGNDRRSEALILQRRCSKLIYKTAMADEPTLKFARRCIVNFLMLNAWRRQKLENKLTLEKMNVLKEKVEGFEMQVYLLRQLLNAEKNRVKTASESLKEMLQKEEESDRVRIEIMKKNESLEQNFNELAEYCSQLEGVCKNQENEIITSRVEAENWEKQLIREREKLKKMETDEIQLREKIQIGEKMINAKSQQLEQLTDAYQDLQDKLSFQVPLWDETMAQLDSANNKLTESESIREKLQKSLEEKDNLIKQLNSKIAALEKKLQEEDERNGILGKSILEKTNELNLMEKRIGELSEIQYPWNRVGIVRMASFCAKIPVACICTVGSLLFPFPSYRL